MGRLKTTEEKTKKKMDKNPNKYSAGLSALPEGETTPKKEYTPEEQDLIKKGATEERQRILALVFGNKETMTAEHKVLVKHTGSYLTGSMSIAYSRAFNDIIKLILKENT